MDTRTPKPTSRRLKQLLGTCLLVVTAALLAPAAGSAAVSTFGSPLSVPATLNTAENLGYYGTYTAVPPTPQVPNGVVHTQHYGADTALWNVALGSGSPAVPATGQALKIALEGCALSSPGGPAPLTQIHFQDVSPLPGGGAKVNLTSQAFTIPVCGENGASGSTVSTYEPVNLCVSQGDYVSFNDNGGYVPNVYRAGVGYKVLGSVPGSTADSFIRNNGTMNGAMLSPTDSSANDGFAVNKEEELMMQVTLGTGPDATHICPGGTRGLPPPQPPIGIRPQTDGVNSSRIVAVAIYCNLSPECKGTATLTLLGRSASVGRAGFNLPAHRTSHLPIRLAPQLMKLIRKHHGVTTTIAAVVAGKTVTQTVTVKIL